MGSAAFRGARQSSQAPPPRRSSRPRLRDFGATGQRASVRGALTRGLQRVDGSTVGAGRRRGLPGLVPGQGLQAIGGRTAHARSAAPHVCTGGKRTRRRLVTASMYGSSLMCFANPRVPRPPFSSSGSIVSRRATVRSSTTSSRRTKAKARCFSNRALEPLLLELRGSSSVCWLVWRPRQYCPQALRTAIVHTASCRMPRLWYSSPQRTPVSGFPHGRGMGGVPG